MSVDIKKTFDFSKFKFVSVFCCKAFARALFLCAVFLLTSIAPRLELQGLHELTRFSGVSSPPFITGIRWSASVAGLPHQ